VVAAEAVKTTNVTAAERMVKGCQHWRVNVENVIYKVTNTLDPVPANAVPGREGHQ
jgi:hypothetical protein